eukprot:TRINITY_DN4374_c0_g1_i1.p1 TRINITY_DN4374_c0_g1~~TRINITY_DN4374_c0_g1_i1.p1  ORF type:complete len:144 (-),score=10.13 TRINITY_DN4374_c0_g1_i1:338-769(-)
MVIYQKLSWKTQTTPSEKIFLHFELFAVFFLKLVIIIMNIIIARFDQDQFYSLWGDKARYYLKTSKRESWRLILNFYWYIISPFWLLIIFVPWKCEALCEVLQSHEISKLPSDELCYALPKILFGHLKEGFLDVLRFAKSSGK